MGKSIKNHPEILVLCQLFYPELISTGQILTELCEVLVEFGAKIEVLCGPPTITDRKTKVPRYLEYKGIKIKRVWGTRFPKLIFIGKLFNQVSYVISTFFYLLFDFSKRPILVLTDPPFLAAICLITKILGGKPYVYLIFDVYPDTVIKLGLLKENSTLAKFWNWWNRIILKNASAVIVIGQCMKKIIIHKAKGIKGFSDKLHFIHVWSDDRLIKPIDRKENPYIKKWNLDQKFVVSYSGNMGRFHDMETIMEATKELSAYKDITFLFIGEGYKKKWMEEYANNWKLKNCKFYTYVNRDDQGFSMACAHVGLVSLLSSQIGLSVPSKTFGIMAAGIPVIGIIPPKSEIALVLEENSCGLVVEPGDAKGLAKSILRLYKSPELCKDLGEKGILAINNKYSLKIAAQKYLSIIESLQY